MILIRLLGVQIIIITIKKKRISRIERFELLYVCHSRLHVSSLEATYVKNFILFYRFFFSLLHVFASLYIGKNTAAAYSYMVIVNIAYGTIKYACTEQYKWHI